MIVWGFIVAGGLLGGLFLQSFALMVFAFLLSVILLHSYAAFQLHKSIRNPTIPLSGQTSMGLRFVGFVALFFGVSYIAYGVSILQNPGEVLKLMQPQLGQVKGFGIGYVRVMGCIALFLSICISVNVFLNFRLLRWYVLNKQHEGK